MLLNTVPLGVRCRVRGVQPGGRLAFRLMELGMIEGAEVQVLRRAPLGDPVQLRLGDYELSLRTTEAALVDVATL
jgi:ferrous iron transport protein A